MVMKYYEYGSLRDFLHNEKHRKRVLNEKQWCPIDFAYDVANALTEMHHTGVTHNDVKVYKEI
jgi:serine/threonine protein kinase